MNFGTTSNVMPQLIAASNLNASGLAQIVKVAPSTITHILHEQVCPGYDDMIHYVYCLGFDVMGSELLPVLGICAGIAVPKGYSHTGVSIKLSS